MAFHEEEKPTEELLKFPERYVEESDAKTISEEEIVSLKKIYKAA